MNTNEFKKGLSEFLKGIPSLLEEEYSRLYTANYAKYMTLGTLKKEFRNWKAKVYQRLELCEKLHIWRSIEYNATILSKYNSLENLTKEQIRKMKTVKERLQELLLNIEQDHIIKITNIAVIIFDREQEYIYISFPNEISEDAKEMLRANGFKQDVNSEKIWIQPLTYESEEAIILLFGKESF